MVAVDCEDGGVDGVDVSPEGYEIIVEPGEVFLHLFYDIQPALVAERDS